MEKSLIVPGTSKTYAFCAMKLNILNCEYLHQLEVLIDMYNHSEFSRDDQDDFIILFYKRIDKLTNDYEKICSLKLKITH